MLDEPTNDLDIETLELLESFLIDWPGTLLLVSHDRAFIDHVVTSTLVFEGGAACRNMSADMRTGCGSETRRARCAEQAARATKVAPSPKERPAPATVVRDFSRANTTAAKKLSYREQEEARTLPVRIEALEREQAELNETVAGPAFYRSPADTITKTLARLETIQRELLTVYARWAELDARST